MAIIFNVHAIPRKVFEYDPILPCARSKRDIEKIKNKIKAHLYSNCSYIPDIKLTLDDRDYLLSNKICTLYGEEVFIVGKAQMILQAGYPYNKTFVLEHYDLTRYDSTDFNNEIPEYFLPIILSYQLLYGIDVILYIQYRDTELIKNFHYDTQSILEMIDNIKIYIMREYNNLC